MKLEPGDVVLVPFPFADLTTALTRPAVILSNAEFNGSEPDIIVCAVTSNLTPARYSVMIRGEDLASGRLRAPSRARVNRIARLEKSLVRRRLGRLSSHTMSKVLRELRALFPP